MAETTRTIGEFFVEVAGKPTPERSAARANEEMAELIRGLSEGNHIALEIEEAADVVIVLSHMAHVNGLDLWAEVEKKMEKNRARTWAKDGSGCAYHVKETE